MSIAIPELTPLEKSLYVTLELRALDNRAAEPILGDALADEVVRKLGHDCGKHRPNSGGPIEVAHRARKLDEVAQRFIARNPDAVGLDLGAGLDSRAYRIDTPDTVDWYDVDLPGVVAARQQVLPGRRHTYDIAADLTDASWLDGVPNDRPAVIVADGLVAFLTEDEMATLVNRLVDHFPSGEIAFNGYTRLHMWVIKRYRGTASIADLVKAPGYDDPRTPERWCPRVQLVREILLTREPEVAEYPAALRFVTRAVARSVALSRRTTTVLHYRF